MRLKNTRNKYILIIRIIIKAINKTIKIHRMLNYNLKKFNKPNLRLNQSKIPKKDLIH